MPDKPHLTRRRRLSSPAFAEERWGYWWTHERAKLGEDVKPLLRTLHVSADVDPDINLDAFEQLVLTGKTRSVPTRLRCYDYGDLLGLLQLRCRVITRANGLKSLYAAGIYVDFTAALAIALASGPSKDLGLQRTVYGFALPTWYDPDETLCDDGSILRPHVLMPDAKQYLFGLDPLQEWRVLRRHRRLFRTGLRAWQANPDASRLPALFARAATLFDANDLVGGFAELKNAVNICTRSYQERELGIGEH